MRKLLASLIAALMGSVSFAQGQRADEQYIPLGKSPGLSGRDTAIGRIGAVDAGERRLTVEGSLGTEVAEITGRTRIWADLTQIHLSNTEGSFDDLREGRTVEVKYEDADRRRFADWIKVEIASAEDWEG